MRSGTHNEGELKESPSSNGRGDAAAVTEIDDSLLEDSLRLSPWQRLIENNRALALVRMLEQARIRPDGRP